jgi:hypothetical protein
MIYSQLRATVHAVTRATARARAALPVLPLLALTALSGCSGASTGKPNSQAAQGYAEQFQAWVLANPHLVAALVVTIIVLAILAWAWKSWPVRIIGIAIIVAVIAYTAGTHH